VDDAALRRALLAWYRRHARDLPWRRRRDPYSTWVSEAMLQQTRVDVATPYFERWMERFPTVQALARADLDDALRAWAGLGYYSRARNLHAAARRVADHGMPATAAGLAELPGVGTYTAGAIASIAFGERVPAVDGNVIRVLARLNSWPGAASSPRLRAKVDAAAARLVPARSPGDWNQALMDLGATVCTPRNPRCTECPVARHCQALALGKQDKIPAAKATVRPRVERRAFAVVRRGDALLLVRNPETGLLAGLWLLPGGDAARPLPEVVLEQAGVHVRPRGEAATARHQFSHRTWEMTVQHADLLADGAGPPAAQASWVALADLDGHALPTAMRTALAAAGVAKPKRRQGSARP
jgi:A/G-specific adenine glycosylase